MDGVTEALHLQHIHEDLDIELNSPIPIFTDSKACVDRVNLGHGTKQNKHLHKRYNFIRDKHLEGIVNVQHIAGVDNPSDMLTKPLSWLPFLKHRRSIGMEYLRVLKGEATADELDGINKSERVMRQWQAIIHSM